MMRQCRAIALSFCVLLSAPLPVWNSGQEKQSPVSTPENSRSISVGLRIQSKLLRIEFDRKLHSRVVPLFDGTAKLVPWSASETVTGVDRVWNDFVLTSSHHERVSDIFGGGEQLILTGKS